MTKFAVVTDDTITNIIVADSKEIAEEVTKQKCIEITEGLNASIGYIYDSELDQWINPQEGIF